MKPARCKQNPPAWHGGFEVMLPKIESHARIAFRHLTPEAREEAIQETVCHACQVYARLSELGKADVAYPGTLARFGVAQVRAGRRVGGRMNCRDVLSDYCQRRKNLTIERLDRSNLQEQGWAQILVEDKHAGPADTAIVRLDFSAWLQLLPRRMRRIAEHLATGETTSAVAERFHVSPARISQIRREFYNAWHRFQGDTLAGATV